MTIEVSASKPISIVSIAPFTQEFTYEQEITQDAPTWFKAWMPYTALTNKESEQYQLQQKAHTDENGFRRIGNDYMIAMGSYYAKQCGDRFKITLEDEIQFTAIIGDIKADCHTDELKQYCPIYIDGELALANILEFIVDAEVMDADVLNSGTVCSLGFEGEIVKIEKIEIVGEK